MCDMHKVALECACVETDTVLVRVRMRCAMQNSPDLVLPALKEPLEIIGRAG
jgi:hypothetical protein